MRTFSMLVKMLVLVAFLVFYAVSSAIAASTSKPKELNIAYFLQWPTPNQIGQMEKAFAKEMGIKVNWRSFDNGNAMNRAMVSGDIDISYSNGFPPYVNGITSGMDMVLVGVSVTYSESDLCIASNKSGINRHNAKTSLVGKKVGTPIGNNTHYKFLRTMEYLGVDVKKVKVLPMANSDTAAALVRGDIDMACGFGSSLETMKKIGKPLMTGAEQEAEMGLGSFDVIAVRGAFAGKYPNIVTQFLAITEKYNNLYKKNPSKYYKTLAKASGDSVDATVATLKKFSFPTKEQQLSKQWLGGGIQTYAKEIADFFVEQKQTKNSLSQAAYSETIQSKFLKDIK